MRHRIQSSAQRPGSPRRGRLNGFTLIELLVGLVLGMLTVLVISTVLANAEGKRRTIAMGSDAQANGTLSLYTLQRDMQMAGYGAAINPEALGCAIKGEYKDPSADASLPAIPFSTTLAPVVITDGAGGAPDQITVLQSRTRRFSAPMLLSINHPKTTEVFTVKSTFGATAGDLMIAVPAGGGDADNWCTVFTVTDAGSGGATGTVLDGTQVPHKSGGTSKWNRSSVFPDAGYLTGSYLLNMGQMSFNSYSIDANQNLVVTGITADAATGTPEILYPQIVNLQAMYGKATAGTTQVSSYDNTTPTTAADWQRVLAIRIALVARSNQYEKDIVTSSAPLWDVGASSTVSGTVACGTSKCIQLKINHVPDWQHYRFKVYDTVVPLRNVLWNSAKTPGSS